MFGEIASAVIGFSFGLFTAGAVFTTIIVIGLVPRFAARFHTARKIFLYEGWVMAGSVAGGIYGVFESYCQEVGWEERTVLWKLLGMVLVVLWGFFTGMFVGCLAVAIEELLGGISVFARRIHLRKGIGIAMLAIAIGKTCGSLYYFWFALFS